MSNTIVRFNLKIILVLFPTHLHYFACICKIPLRWPNTQKPIKLLTFKILFNLGANKHLLNDTKNISRCRMSPIACPDDVNGGILCTLFLYRPLPGIVGMDTSLMQADVIPTSQGAVFGYKTCGQIYTISVGTAGTTLLRLQDKSHVCCLREFIYPRHSVRS